jgi:flavin-dependent dehydrogenase
LAELADLGILQQLENDSLNLEMVRFTIDGCSAPARIGWTGTQAIGVSRLKLDASLLDFASRAGADVETDLDVRELVSADGRFELKAEGQTLGARVVVAADGLRSGLRRQAGLSADSRGRRYGVSAHIVLSDSPPPRIDVYFERGYEVYITPLGGKVVNAAVLLDRTRVEELAGRLREGYTSLVASVRSIGSGFELVDEPLAVGPFPAAATSVWRDNLVLVGDAAGFFDPISGNGMTLALVSARRCAAAIDAHLETGSVEPLRTYERRCRALARNSTLFARVILALAARPGLGRRVLKNLGQRPETFAKLAAINDGELGLGSLRPRDLLAFAAGL